MAAAAASKPVHDILIREKRLLAAIRFQDHNINSECKVERLKASSIASISAQSTWSAIEVANGDDLESPSQQMLNRCTGLVSAARRSHELALTNTQEH